MSRAKHVAVDREAVTTFASRLVRAFSVSVQAIMSIPEINGITLTVASRAVFGCVDWQDTAMHHLKWDASEWHYTADATTGATLTIQYIFVLDAMNFCFWPSTTKWVTGGGGWVVGQS